MGVAVGGGSVHLVDVAGHILPLIQADHRTVPEPGLWDYLITNR